VGESGCGKSVTSAAILRLLPAYARTGGEILLYEKDGERFESLRREYLDENSGQ
jgi:ABC-type dipeptide/oligopeptide/nickel transport system ATPase component